MMAQIYQKPYRVYFLTLIILICGLYLGKLIPISLFPEATRPKVSLWVHYGSWNREQFIEKAGIYFEGHALKVKESRGTVDNVESWYFNDSVYYELTFSWGDDLTTSKRIVTDLFSSLSPRLEQKSRDNHFISQANETGFFALTFYSALLNSDEIYETLKDEINRSCALIPGIDQFYFWNPQNKQLVIEVNPEKLALLNITPKDIINAISQSKEGYQGGGIVEDGQKIAINWPAKLKDTESLKNILITSKNNQRFLLQDLAQITLKKPENSTIFKTNGSPSLILNISPKSGIHLNQLAGKILNSVAKIVKKHPHINYKILVDPSKSIHKAISNVTKEVIFSALLAIFILFIFMGDFKNTCTMALEIPLSIFFALTLMYFCGVTLNLVSLGGLALSTGMNVDASVVVMENILHHLGKNTLNTPLTYQQRFSIVLQAVKEVRWPIITSTLTSLVVFLPLVFTSDLSYAILGDLAKSVVFSHGFSAITALILVPTIRLQLSGLFKIKKEKKVNFLQNGYINILRYFLLKKNLQIFLSITLIFLFVFSVFWIPKQLDKELIGLPESKIISINVVSLQSVLVEEKEALVDSVLRKLKNYQADYQYTFSRIWSQGNNSQIYVKFNSIKAAKHLKEVLSAQLVNNQNASYNVFFWNPTRLDIPFMYDLKLVVNSKKSKDAPLLAFDLQNKINSYKIFKRNVWSNVNYSLKEDIILSPNDDIIQNLTKLGELNITADSILNMAKMSYEGLDLGYMTTDDQNWFNMVLKFPEDQFKNINDFMSLPIRVKDKIIPIKSLFKIKRKLAANTIYHEKGNHIIPLFGVFTPKEKQNKKKHLQEISNIIKDFNTSEIELADPQKDFTKTIHDLQVAVIVSLLLVFTILFLQFGSFIDSIIIMSSTFFGILGVLLSLYIFKSTLSINSVLGLILQNGICVANSIMLVDVINRFKKQNGPLPLTKENIIKASASRLRPILMTSLTTIFGMMPIAFGYGEGGNILKPLGLAVCGGLMVSLIFSLFYVPLLAYLKNQTIHAGHID